MKANIFIRSYSGDFEWLTFCLRSIARYATGFNRVVVVTPEGQHPPTGTMEVTFQVKEGFDGYMHQQSTKLHADMFSDADYILFTDSDTIFTRSIRPHECINQHGEVKWLYTPRASMGKDRDVWREATERAVGQKVEHEFMRRHPFCVPRWALEGFRRWFWQFHGQSLESYISAQPDRNFSEWNAIGAWLWIHHRKKVQWINTDDELGEPFVKQHFSWGGLTEQARADMELVLA